MKISEKYTKYKNIIPFGIIFAIVILSSMLFSSHSMQILSDRGRELLIPMSILNGETPYKDILMIYFPLAYYINSILFKIFGNTDFYNEDNELTKYISSYYQMVKMYGNKENEIIVLKRK